MALRRAKKNIDDALDRPDASNDTKTSLRQILKRTITSIDGVEEQAKRIKLDEDGKREIRAIALSVKLQEHDDDLFNQFATDGEMSEGQYAEMLRSIGIEDDYNFVFTDALAITKTPKISLPHYNLFIRSRYLRVKGDAELCESLTDKIGAVIDKEEVLKVLSVPEASDGSMMYEVLRLRTDKTGFVAALKNNKPCLERFTHRFTCVQETVLTDSLELKGFAVLRRLKEGDEFIASDVPVSASSAGLLRVRGTSGGITGWTTIRGNQGTSYLSGTQQEANNKEVDPITPIPDEIRNTQLERIREESLAAVETALKEVGVACEGLDTRSLELACIFDATPSKEDINSATKNVDEAYEAAQKALTQCKLLLVEHARIVAKCTSDQTPLGQLRAALGRIPEQLNTFQNQALDLRKQTDSQIAELNKNEEARLHKEAMALAEEKVAEWDKTISVLEEEVTDEVKKAELVTEDCCDDAEAISTCVGHANAIITKAILWIEEVTSNESDKCLIGPYQRFRVRLKSFRDRVQDFKRRADAIKAKLYEMEKEQLDTARLEVGIALRNYLQGTGMTAAQVMDGGDVMSFDKFKQIAKDAGVTSIEDRVLRSVFTSAGSVVREAEFDAIAKPRFVIMKATAMTDVFEMKNSKNVLKLAEDEVIECIGLPEQEETAKIMRIRARLGETEGYCTITGNRGTNFLVPYHPAYRVRVETVMTDTLQMRGFKVVRRLKLGEVIFTNEQPKREEVSGLLRLKGFVRSSEGIIEGYVTVRGKDEKEGIKYLDNVPVSAVEEELKEAIPSPEEEPKEKIPSPEEEPKEKNPSPEEEPKEKKPSAKEKPKKKDPSPEEEPKEKKPSAKEKSKKKVPSPEEEPKEAIPSPDRESPSEKAA